MYKATIIKIFIGFMWIEYQTTNVDEATNFHNWMILRGHSVLTDHEFVTVDREIPTIERITNT